jgi:hypothetical protein
VFAPLLRETVKLFVNVNNVNVHLRILAPELSSPSKVSIPDKLTCSNFRGLKNTVQLFAIMRLVLLAGYQAAFLSGDTISSATHPPVIEFAYCPGSVSSPCGHSVGRFVSA